MFSPSHVLFEMLRGLLLTLEDAAVELVSSPKELADNLALRYYSG
jgi:hypothetical protein